MSSATPDIVGALHLAASNASSGCIKESAYPLRFQAPEQLPWADWTTHAFPSYDQFLIGDTVPLAHGDTYVPSADGSVYANYCIWVLSLAGPGEAGRVVTTPFDVAANFRRRQVEARRTLTAYKAGMLARARGGAVGQGVNIAAALQNPPTVSDASIQRFSDLAAAYLAAGAGAQDPLLTQALHNLQQVYTYKTASQPVTAGFTEVGTGSQTLAYNLPNWQIGSFPAHQPEPVPVTWSPEAADAPRLLVELGALVRYEVHRDNWFSTLLLKRYKDHALAWGKPADFFDAKQGSLALIPAYIIVGFAPTFTLTAATARYSGDLALVQAAIRALGAFAAPGGEPLQPQVLQQDANITTVRLETPRTDLAGLTPAILGYLHDQTEI